MKRRLLTIGAIVAGIVFTGSLGYYLLFSGEVDFMDCVFMTVISLTSVGYGEVLPVTGNPRVEIFTILLITFGMGIILYGISTLTAILVEGELSGLLRRRKMDKQIKKLRGHYIVVGGGETGLPALAELVENNERVVLVEMDPEKIAKFSFVKDLIYVEGDATEDNNLLAAGIEHAAGILICLPEDKDNLYVTMTARMLNPSIRIISRMVSPKLEPKLLKAGADRVVSPNTIGALRMASEMIRPTVVTFLDSMLRSKQGHLRINQIEVTQNSGLVGQELRTSGLRNRYGLLVLGAREPGHETTFNPPPEHILKAGTTLVVMGDIDKINRARRAF